MFTTAVEVRSVAPAIANIFVAVAFFVRCTLLTVLFV